MGFFSFIGSFIRNEENMFADRAKIYIRSGKGGDGAVSFRREKYVAAGGPDGGDGGRGGDVIFEVDEGLNSLNDFRHIRKYCAGNGENGGGRRCKGSDGEDIVVKVPEGTVIKDFETGKVIADMSYENRREVILKGGRGGYGNQRYATPTMQVPKYAQPGQKAVELYVTLELKMIADVGLVGFPNVGKSTLLSRTSNAKPKIANYHFTTLSPNLGVVDLGTGESFVMADIPGLIEGASEGIGLGHEFLRHVERTRVLIHVVDVAGSEGRDPVNDINAIRDELSKYNEELANLPSVIAANKTDIFYDEEEENEALKKLHDAFDPEGIKIFPISAVSGKGIKELLYYVNDLLKKTEKKHIVFEKEFDADDIMDVQNPIVVTKVGENEFSVEGSKVARMLGYTNLDDEKGFDFFQNFLKTNAILDELERLGVQDGDTIKLYDLQFEYYK